MGRFTKMVNRAGGLLWPIFQSMRKIDLRLKAVDVPTQEMPLLKITFPLK